MFSFKNITFGQYLDTQSVIHRLDPRTKLASVLMIMATCLVINSFSFFLLLTGGFLALVFIARLPVRFFLGTLYPFFWLLVITFLIHLFFTPGRSIDPFPVYGINATQEGLVNAVLFSYRIAVLVLIAVLFTLTTSPIEVADACERILRPFQRWRVPAHELSMVMTIAMRFVPTLVQEADRLQKAQMVRGMSCTGGCIKRTKALIPLFAPLFVSVFRRAGELAAAMDARCYRGGEGRTHYRELVFTGKDYLALACVVVMCLTGLLARQMPL